MTELQAFELFRPEGHKLYFICARTKSIGISKDAYYDLNQPDYVLVYTDDVKNRIMIKTMDKRYDNCVRVVKHSAGGSHKSRNMCLCCRPLTKKLTEMFGRSNRIYGHLVTDGVMIFDKVEEKSCQEMN